MTAINVFQSGRRYLKDQIDGLTEAQLRLIPDGFNNNVIWHLGHLVATQQLLHYRRAGIPLYVTDAFVDQFKNGTSPRDWQNNPDSDEILTLFLSLPEKLEQDYADSRFSTSYNGFTTRSGFSLNSIDNAIIFNNFHEGIHTGYVMAMKKLLG